MAQELESVIKLEETCSHYLIVLVESIRKDHEKNFLYRVNKKLKVALFSVSTSWGVQ